MYLTMFNLSPSQNCLLNSPQFHVHSLSVSPPPSLSPLSPILCCLHIHEFGAIPWSMANWLRAIPLKKNVLFLLQKQLTASSSSVRCGGSQAFSSSVLEWWLVWSSAGKPQVLWVHECHSPVVFRGHCSTLVFSNLTLTVFIPSLPQWCLSLVESGYTIGVPICGWVLVHSFSALWPVVSASAANHYTEKLLW